MTNPHKTSRKWLRGYRLAYGRVIPPEARVNPDEFPEEEYPVYCPDCDYLLRGLPDNHCCPECGRPFERGRLLVEQYAIEEGKRHWTRARRFSRITGTAGCILIAFAVLSILVLQKADTFLIGMPLGRMDIYIVLFYLLCLGCAQLFISICLLLSSLRRERACRDKSKQVYEAIEQTGPPFIAAKRYTRILHSAGIFLFVSLLVWCVYDFYIEATGAIGYYISHPSRMIGPLSSALPITGAGYVIYRLFRYKYPEW